MVGFILSWVCQVYIWLLFVGFFVSIIRQASPSWRPRGALLVILEVILTVTEVPLKAIRKVIKPVRVGAIAFDLAWTALFLGVVLLRNWVQYLPF